MTFVNWDDPSIDDLLQRAKSAKKEYRGVPIPQNIVFTVGAYRKSSLLGPMIYAETDQHLEWSGFMLARKNDPSFIVRDVLIQRGQDITQGIVRIKGEDVAKASHEVDKLNRELPEDQNLYVAGWIHGHGLAYLHPSGVDKDNFKVVTNSASLNTERSGMVPFNLIETDTQYKIENGKLVMHGEALEDGSIEFPLIGKNDLEEILRKNGITPQDLKKDAQARKVVREILEASSPQVFQPEIRGFSYFVIMNNKNETPYGEIGFLTEKPFSKEKVYSEHEKVNVRSVKVKDDIRVDQGALLAEIKSKIKLPSKFFYFFGRQFRKKDQDKARIVRVNHPNARYWVPGFGWVKPRFEEGIGHVIPYCKKIVSDYVSPAPAASPLETTADATQVEGSTADSTDTAAPRRIPVAYTGQRKVPHMSFYLHEGGVYQYLSDKLKEYNKPERAEVMAQLGGLVELIKDMHDVPFAKTETERKRLIDEYFERVFGETKPVNKGNIEVGEND